MSDDFFFDADSAPTGTFDPLPPGRYPVVVIGAVRKDSKNGRGEYLELTLKVTGGEHDGRNLWDRCIIAHPNVQASDIGRARLATLCRAINVLRPSDPEELLNYRVIAVVKITRHRDSGEPQNEVARYLPEEQSGPPAAAPARPVAASPAPHNSSPAPWGTNPAAKAPSPASPPSSTPGPDTYA